MAEQWIIQGDCRSVLPKLPRAKMVFADPPDNIGYSYEGFEDKWPSEGHTYGAFLEWLTWYPPQRGGIYWLSHNSRYEAEVMDLVQAHHSPAVTATRRFLWIYTFGQHNKYDFGTSYRPILRMMQPGQPTYPDAVRVPSARMKYGDKRADPRGRVPGDVWDFPRVCGNFKERRKWASTQHPEALMERIIRFSCVPGDLVIDLFGHSFTTARVCRRLGIDCISIEISEFYCRRGAEELGVPVIAAEIVEPGVWPPNRQGPPNGCEN